MKFNQLSLTCPCGRTPSRLKSVGLTAGHQLVVHWRCPACGKFVYFVKSLSDCWRECPRQEGSAEEVFVAAGPGFQQDDVTFLRSLGVTLPEGDA